MARAGIEFFGGRDKVARELAPAIQSATDRIIRSRNRRG